MAMSTVPAVRVRISLVAVITLCAILTSCNEDECYKHNYSAEDFSDCLYLAESLDWIEFEAVIGNYGWFSANGYAPSGLNTSASSGGSGSTGSSMVRRFMRGIPAK
jgi:hypothetical protein